MKPKNKTLKAIAVVAIVAVGIANNIEMSKVVNRTGVVMNWQQSDINEETYQHKSLLYYTGSVVVSGIKQLILSR
ncbi:MAG: hypothetical protein H6Q20_1479 [Bacteroidetes bacterium]|nr:hypothetical protein [Bacteroidota bacterium]